MHNQTKVGSRSSRIEEQVRQKGVVNLVTSRHLDRATFDVCGRHFRVSEIIRVIIVDVNQQHIGFSIPKDVGRGKLVLLTNVEGEVMNAGSSLDG